MGKLMVSVLLPLRLVSTLNQREHWTARARRAKEHRNVARLKVASACWQRAWLHPTPPLSIGVTRIGPRLLDKDNAYAACKSVIDGVCDALGVDDGDERVTVECKQEKGPYGVRVEVWS